MHSDGGQRRGGCSTGGGDQGAPRRSEREAEREIVSLLLAGPYLWTSAEIERELDASAADVEDALAGLRRAGLVNINGSGISASRTARAMDELDV